MITSGISQIGGKFRLRKTLLEYTPYHEFFLSGFCGACWYELNKPRVRYECFNDIDSDFINYLLVIHEHPEEFDDLKKGVFGLVSQEICKRIENGELIPRNNIERAYFFYYLNKLCFGGTSKKGYRGIILKGSCVKESIEEAKHNYQGIAPKVEIDTLRKQSSYKGINPKTTRPYSNNDCGLLSPLDPKAIKRLRYVNLTSYDFRKVHKMFHRAFYKKKGLTKECFLYFDPPYPSTESYYQTPFDKEDHLDLINLMIESPFHIMLSIGGDCDFYLDALQDAGFTIIETQTRYSISATTQDVSTEYIIINYNINKVPKMAMGIEQTNLIEFIEG